MKYFICAHRVLVANFAIIIDRKSKKMENVQIFIEFYVLVRFFFNVKRDRILQTHTHISGA